MLPTKAYLKTKRWFISTILDKLPHNGFENPANRVRSVVILLGPYRNLTTLIASIMALHPNCRVLNHAGIRILGEPNIDFLKNYSDETFKNFKKFALYASLGGTRGNFGGNIFYSHAFDESLKQKASKIGLLEEDEVFSILWKESLLVSNYLRDNDIHTDELIRYNSNIKFVMPVRNPLACAKSNWEKGKFEEYYKNCSTYFEVLESIIKDYAWYLKQREANPENFFHFFEDEFDEKLLNNLCNFFGIELSNDWAEFVLDNFTPNRDYQFDKNTLAKLNILLSQYLDDFPHFKHHVQRLAGD